jgi:hypothetical protein
MIEELTARVVELERRLGRNEHGFHVTLATDASPVTHDNTIHPHLPEARRDGTTEDILTLL